MSLALELSFLSSFVACSSEEQQAPQQVLDTTLAAPGIDTGAEPAPYEPCTEELPSLEQNLGSAPAWSEPLVAQLRLTNPCGSSIVLLGSPENWLSSPFFMPELPPITLPPMSETLLEVAFAPEAPASLEQSFQIVSSYQPINLTLTAETTAPLAMVVQGGNFAASSSNLGETFLLDTPNSPQPIRRDLCYGNERFIAVGGGDAGHFWSSNDGSNWSNESTSGEPFISCVYGQQFFVAISESLPYHSIAGLQWNEGSGTPWMHDPLHDITYGEERFIAVGNKGRITYTEDGNGWMRDESFSSFDLFKIVYGHEIFVAAGSFGGVLISNDRGQTWNEHIVGSRDIRNLLVTHRGFLLSNGAEIYRSENGEVWELWAETDIKILSAMGDKLFGAQGPTLFEGNLSEDMLEWSELSQLQQPQPIKTAHFARAQP